MTLALTQPPILLFGQYAVVDVTITGGSVVHSVTLDFIGDGQPAWYFTVPDARGSGQYPIGPMKKRGRFEIMALARDIMGCEITNGVRLWVTVQ